jgi:hypothetical protein
MSEFERIDQSSAWADAGELQFPEDFSPDEVAFAGKMRELFAIESEELPPLFTQTLLDNMQYEIPGRGFEYRVTSAVFHRLQLSRSPAAPSDNLQSGVVLDFSPPRESLTRRLRSALLTTRSYFRRPIAAGISLIMVMLSLTIVVASPVLAQGLKTIFGNTGVEQVTSVPTTSAKVTDPKKREFSLAVAPTIDPSMPLFWPGPVTDNYAYEGTHLQEATKWSDGAIVDMQYSLPNTSLGSGMLDIREFQVSDAYSAVLQVVEDGFATSVTLADGEPAVYVNGMWVPRFLDHTETFVWQTGTHCLLIMERQDVVIWMVGDPRDGITAASMTAIASQMVPVNRATLMRNYRGVWLASASLVISVNNALGSECYLLVPQGISPASGTGEFVFSGSGTGVGPSSGSGPSPGQ